MSIYTAANNTLSLEESRAKMQKSFALASAASTSEQAAGWVRMWEAGNFLPFDRGFPNPALADAVSTHPELFDLSSQSGQRKQALIPGCGRGYDAILLSAFGFDAFGLEIAPEATRSALLQATHELRPESSNLNTLYKPKTTEGRGQITFVNGDFFANPSTWIARGTLSPGPNTLAPANPATQSPPEQYDLIYDYTFLCALPPPLRHKWAASMSRLLAPGGRLLCVEFPTEKPVSTGGPPFGLPESVYTLHLSYPGVELPYKGNELQVEAAAESGKKSDVGKGLVRIARWKATLTHEIGKGKDWVSVWEHAK